MWPFHTLKLSPSPLDFPSTYAKDNEGLGGTQKSSRLKDSDQEGREKNLIANDDQLLF